MWKGNENDEYESSSPAIQAHFHALKAEEAYRKRDVSLVYDMMCVLLKLLIN
jgi:hypothetical protein